MRVGARLREGSAAAPWRADRSIVNIEKGRQHLAAHQVYIFAEALKVRADAIVALISLALSPRQHIISGQVWAPMAYPYGSSA
jgi:hypothetical protein